MITALILFALLILLLFALIVPRKKHRTKKNDSSDSMADGDVINTKSGFDANDLDDD